MTPVALAALTLIAGSAVSRAQSCSGSPSYSPDFSSNQGCFSLLGNGYNSTPTIASFQPGSGGSVLLQVTPNSQQQRGYAWYISPQAVGNSFSTTFTFQLSGTGGSPADGFAFVIQNSAAGASTVGPTGSDGCGLGFGDDPSGAGGVCVNATGGITNSVAVGFKTSNNGSGIPSPDSVFIANNGSGANCVNTGTGGCVIAENDLSGAGGCNGSGICLADGNVHTVTITYAIQPLSSQTACVSASKPCLDVILDGTDLFPSGVPFSMGTIGLTNNAAYVGFTGATGGSVENNDILSWVFSPQSFGEINVCTPGQTTPAPCSNTLPVTLAPSAGTINTIEVDTQGTPPQATPGLDFQAASGGTCAKGAEISAGNTCTVNVTFAPIAPGLRLGAVQLLDNSGNPLGTAQFYGVGEGPAVAFGPGTQTTVNTGSNSLTVPNGVAVDAAGDIFIADGGNGNVGGGAQVLKVAPGGGVSSVGFNLAYPQGLAVDGGGNVYIADNNLNEVLKVPPGCNNIGCQQVVATPQCVVGVSGFCAQLGVAVDGIGDVFIASYNSEVLEVPANGGAQTVVYNPPGSHPIGLATDAAGDLFIADYGLHKVVEVPADGGAQTTVGTDWSQPEAVAVDAAGDVFVADESLGEVEVPAGCTNNLDSCQITISNILAYGVAVDAKGDVFLPERNGTQLAEINRSQSPSLSFALTNVDSTSSDSPRSVTVQNIGNQTLSAVSPGLAVNGPNFVQVPGSGAPGTPADCSTTFSLTEGASCDLSISFKPQSAGNPLTSTAVFTDNNLNAISPSPAATQTIGLSGVGVSLTYTVGGSVTGLVGSGLVLQDNLGDNLPISGNGAFTFATALNNGSPYSVTVLSSPLAQNCAVTEGGGTVATANVTSVLVSCTTIPSYELSVTEIGSGSGTVTSSAGAISCIDTNGSVTGQCSDSYLSGSPVTLTAAATGTSTFLGWGGACAASGTSPTCNVSVVSVLNATASFAQQSFGSVNVCPSGQTTPAPCSGTLTLTYNLAATTTIGVTQVVTQGINGLDFSLGSGGTCTGTIAEGFSCTVNVTFTPLAPGLRTGSVSLFDNGGNLLAVTPIYGIGQAPAIAFGPGTQTSLGSGLNQPQGVAVDAAGDVFISNYGLGKVLKVTPGGVQTTVPASGLADPYGVAVDGAGDVFIADPTNAKVVKVTPSGVQTTVGSVGYPYGVAVDGAGNVFIVDSANTDVVKVTPSGVQTKVPASGLTNPYDVAVDGAGDVFISDPSNVRVVKVTPSGVQTTVPTSGLVCPYGVAVDAAGDVVIADPCISQVVEVTPSGVQTTIPASGLSNPISVAVDGTGDVFTGNSGVLGVLTKVQRSQPPSLGFALTNVSSTSTDSPQSVSIQNVGNQTLTGSLALSLGTNFGAIGSSTCGSGFSLIPGASCSESFSFTPQTTGYQTGTAAFSDNTLNLSPLVVLQTVNLSGNGGLNGQAVGVLVPNVVGLTQAAATAAITGAGLTLGTVSTASNNVVPSGSVTASNPAAGAQVSVGSAVRLLVSTGQAAPPKPNPLSFENNYFVTGDFASAGVQLRGTGHGGIATGTITIPDSTTSPSVSQGVPDGADIIDAFLYWETLENTASPSGGSGTFDNYPITGQQIGSDLPYTDGALSGTLRVYRADVNTYFPLGANGVRFASGAFTVSLPDGATALPLTEGASLVVIYRVLSPNFPLKSIVIYDGSAVPAISTTQNMQGFYDAAGAGENTALFDVPGGGWNNSSGSVTLPVHASQFSAPLNAGSAYAAVILSTPVNNSDNDGILDAWKAGPASGDFYAGQPGYYDVKNGTWVGLPGAVHGEKDLFVQLDYMCGAVLSDGSCDPNQENLFPSPDAKGNDPLAMVTNAFAANGVHLHLEIGNAVPEDTCTDNTSTTPPQLCQFPSVPGATQPGVIGWKNSLEFSKLWPRNLASCAAGGDCSPRFPYGQKDSYHYVLFGHSLAIPAWNSRYGSLTSINVVSGVTTIVTTDRGNGINHCPSRVTISGVLGNPNLNGVYNTTVCANSSTMTVSTPGVPNWSYPNSTLPEPVIGLTSGTVTSISGYSDLGGSDSAVTLGLWETAPNQNMSKRANVIAGTLFHEIGHTLGLSHGGLYYDGPSGSYVPTFDVNCKPNYQSVMNYLFQLDGVGPNAAIAFSNQQLDGEPLSGPPTVLSLNSLGSVVNLTDASGNPATFSTSAWYTPNAPSPTASAATAHCDGTPLSGDTGYRVNGTIAPIAPAWSSEQNITFDGVPYTTLRGYNDVGNIDLRQVGATGGEFASLASVLSFGSSTAPLNVAAGGSVTLGAGGTVALGSGGTVTLGSGGTATVGSGSTITPGSGGSVTLNNGATVTLPPAGGTVTLGSGGTVALGSGGTVTLGSGGTITLGSGGTIALGSGGTIALGSGGTITSSAGTVTIPSTGGSYTLPSGGGTIALGSGGTIALGSGGTVTLGSGGTIAMGSGGTVALGSGGTIALGSGGTIALESGGTIALGSGGTVTLGSGGTIALGSGGTVALGSGGTVTLGSGGTVTLGSGGDLSLGSGGTVTLGSGGTVALGSGGTVALGSGGNVTLGSGGTIAMGSGGTVALGSGGTVTLGSGGTIALGSGGTVTVPPGGSYTINSSGGTITLGSGGTVTLGSGGTVALGSGGTITMGSGGTVALGSGGTVTLGSGGVVALGSGGTIALGSGGTIALGSGGTVTLGSGGASTNELDYTTANSVVRPPSSPTETPQSTSPSAPVVINWTAPTFGVVATYTISRSSDGATPIVIGSVSGVNGNPPATTFTDTNPDTTAHTVVYTISTTLLPVPIDPSPGQSAPSPPAVLTNNQTIVLGPPALPSSVSISTSPLTVYATAESNNAPNGLQVSFSANSATGACSIASQLPPNSNGVSSATVALNSTGSCTITASQAGTNLSQPGSPPYYNAANSVSGTFTILAQGSNTQSQTINFLQMPNVQYGSTFSLSASSSAGLPVSFTASGPCTASGSTTGVGPCQITASAAAGTVGSNSYSAASGTQSFTIYPAVLTVTANNITGTYGETSLPALTYTTSPLVNGDSPSAVTGAPSLSTTATTASNAGGYPITVSTGTLAAANYSFLFVSGTLTIGQASQAITFTTNAPASAAYNTSFTVAATGSASGIPVTFTSSGACSNIGAIYKMTGGTGTCSVIANQASSTNYSAAPTVTQTVNATLATPTVTFTGAPASAAYNSHFTVAATTNASSAAVITSGGACSSTGTAVTMTSGTGTCSLTATWAADGNFNGATASQSTAATLVAQAITFTTNAPASAAYNSSFTVAATGGASGNPVIFTSSGACSNIGATYKMTNSTGICSVIANQAANANYSAAPTVTQTVNANGPLVTVSPSNIAFGTVNLGSITTKNITVTNIGTAPVTINDPLISIVQGGNSNEFVAVSLCPATLAVGNNCTITIAFIAGPFYTPQTATLEIKDNAPGSPQPVTLTATVLAPQTITFTTNPPASAAYNSSFTVAATGGASGNSVTFTSSGACTNSGATYKMTSGTGTCTVIANQAGNATYAAAALVTRTVTATQAAQTITFTTNPPASAAYNSSFTVAATGGGSGNAVTFTSSGACSNSGATYKMTGSTGTCSVIANQAGNSNYTAAAQVTKSVTATQAAQVITFTTNAPASAAYNSSFTVAATGGGSGNAVTFTSSGACSHSGATYKMTSGTGTCSVIANQAGNSNYAASAQVTQTVTATLAAQTITFTTNPPANAAYNSSFTVAATGGGSGNAVTFASSGACSNSGATYKMTSGTGTCSVIANQAGNSNYAAAAQVTKNVTATLVAQTITFTTNPPSTASNNSSFTVAATGGASGNAVAFTSSGACTNTGATYKMTSSTGTCSVIANQAGNSNYATAAQVTKTVTAKQ
jgi:sugar lactone lactonase YvrE